MVYLDHFGKKVLKSCLMFLFKCPEQPPLLLLGDEKGGVHLMWFLNPSKGLFKNQSKKDSEPRRIFFPVGSISCSSLFVGGNVSFWMGMCFCIRSEERRLEKELLIRLFFPQTTFEHTGSIFSAMFWKGPLWAWQHVVLPSHSQNPPGTNQQSDVWTQW